MMAAASVACALNAVSARARIGFALVAGLGIVVIAINQQKTSAVALAAALLVVVAVRWRKPWLLAGCSCLLALGLASVLLPPVRAATWATLPLTSYQHLTTYRLGAWIAAADMARERPLAGFGPGAFAPEAQSHRLTAELRLHERLTPPTAASFVHAHQDYLQLAAESGVPALLLLLGVIIALFAALARQAPTREQEVVLAISATGIVVALGWFPMHIPFTACVLLLCAGRAWRLVAGTPEATS
jgi:O-antigen ligase